ncbi:MULTISPECIES: hypothetical protein [unclassified Microbulbifer]|uniref:Tse2 family ADP-ribosyltransferase toxin n=1 Tax=unclassified Microbulbifer TaxID=2619833 RepID=UPI0027E4177E|nr:MULTISPECIES: hypothetical protein [unclassified Microbulbifer]
MISPGEFYLMDVADLPFDLFRGGNASGFQFHEDRAMKDCYTYMKDGVIYVGANLTGFSCFDHITDRMKRQGKNVWKLKRGALLPVDLKLVRDERRGHEGHYMLAPAKDMPIRKYIGLLEELERDPSKCTKLTPQEIRNGW